jgi:hypothetical protein
MASRDFSFLTLRNVSAYNPNNSVVEPNRFFVTSTNGAAYFSDNVQVSSIKVNGNAIVTGIVSTSYIGYSQNVNINPSAASVDNGVINIGTAYNPTIGIGSEGSNKNITMNGSPLINGNALVNGRVQISSCNAATPSLYFTTDADSGLYGIGDGTFGMCSNGNNRVTIGPDITITPQSNGNVTINSTVTMPYVTNLNTVNISDSGGINTNNTNTTRIGKPDGTGAIRIYGDTRINTDSSQAGTHIGNAQGDVTIDASNLTITADDIVIGNAGIIPLGAPLPTGWYQLYYSTGTGQLGYTTS